MEAVLPGDGASYAISPAIGRVLARLVLDGSARNVLEIGAGSSSRVLARALMHSGGGRLTSIEQSPHWCRDEWAEVTATHGVDALMLVATPRLRVLREGVYYAYAGAAEALAQRGPFDLLFIDAPQWYFGRDGGLHLAYDSLRQGAWIVLDDAGRPQERWAIRRWLQTYPGLEQVGFDSSLGRNGAAILRHSGDKTRRHPLGPLVSSSVHASVNWITRKVRRLGVEAPA
ncbi:MAG: class I SAM-dependent methyltransferase [Gemmatimonadales bacterium]